MKKSRVAIAVAGLLILFIILIVSQKNKVDPSINEFTKCSLDSDCETPTEFLIQSNCPFTSACIENKCRVVCPIFFGQQDSPKCEKNEDCNCSQRAQKSLKCLCVNNQCVSVEK